jgi:electron transfer flavoprotein beta subunit
MMDDGYDVLDMPLPALITVVKEINNPRLPSLRGKMAAKRAQIPVWSAEDLGVDLDSVGLKGSPTQVIRVFTPERKGRGEIFDGEVEENVSKFVDRLQEIGMVAGGK